MHVRETRFEKKKFSGVASRGLKWENKTYKLKMSLHSHIVKLLSTSNPVTHSYSCDVWLMKAQDVRNFSCLCWRHMCFFLELHRTHLNNFALSPKICVSGLIDDLSSIDEYFFFVSSAVTIYNVLF